MRRLSCVAVLMVFAISLQAQIRVHGVGGIEAAPQESRGVQAFMWGELTLEGEAGPLWAEVGGALYRFTGHESPANPFNLAAGRWEKANGFVRAGLQFGGCRVGARFGRETVTSLEDGRTGSGPEHILPADPSEPRIGYHAEVLPFADCSVLDDRRLTLRGQGPVLYRQGNTLPRSSITAEVVYRIGDNIEVSLYGTFPDPVLTGDNIVLSNGNVINRVASGELRPITVDASIGRWFGDHIFLAVRGGSYPHPGWGAYEDGGFSLRVQRVAALVAFAPGQFRNRQRSMARIR